jgi:carboxyl-terminal processing protease
MKMENKRRIKRFTVLLLITLLIFQVIAVNAEDQAQTASSSSSLDYLQGVMDMIKDKYKGDISDKQLVEGSIKGMFNTMDPYTTFFTPTETESFMGNINGSYTGIGIAMEMSGDYILVSKVFADSPAEKSGIRQGDKIAEVDGKSIVGKSTEEAAALIMGEEGTSTKLGILRAGSKATLYFNVKRAVIKVNPVVSEIRNGIGYIKLEMFNANTGEFLSKALESMDKNKVTKIVLDLRDNPGGEVNQAIAVARNFVPKGIITTLDFNSSSLPDMVYNSYLEKPKYKLAVLVNGMSASASEIVAGAIQDTKAGTLVGTKTFGKAKVQSILPILTQEAFEKYSKQFGVKLVDGFELQTRYGVVLSDSDIAGYTKITTGLYYTPKGRMIDGAGIVPDVTVADPAAKTIDAGSINKFTGTAKLKTGSVGDEVLNMEKLLSLLGYTAETPDNVFDANTSAAVKKFQASAGIKKDGIVGPVTRKALNSRLASAVAASKYDPQYLKAVEILSK